MCSGAILLYGIPKVVVGKNQTFVGEENLLRSRGVAVDVLQDPSCIDLMQRFIRDHTSYGTRISGGEAMTDGNLIATSGHLGSAGGQMSRNGP
jgi:hypothetical protein